MAWCSTDDLAGASCHWCHVKPAYVHDTGVSFLAKLCLHAANRRTHARDTWTFKAMSQAWSLFLIPVFQATFKLTLRTSSILCKPPSTASVGTRIWSWRSTRHLQKKACRTDSRAHDEYRETVARQHYWLHGCSATSRTPAEDITTDKASANSSHTFTAAVLMTIGCSAMQGACRESCRRQCTSQRHHSYAISQSSLCKAPAEDIATDGASVNGVLGDAAAEGHPAADETSSQEAGQGAALNGAALATIGCSAMQGACRGRCHRRGIYGRCPW